MSARKRPRWSSFSMLKLLVGLLPPYYASTVGTRSIETDLEDNTKGNLEEDMAAEIDHARNSAKSLKNPLMKKCGGSKRSSSHDTAYETYSRSAFMSLRLNHLHEPFDTNSARIRNLTKEMLPHCRLTLVPNQAKSPHPTIRQGSSWCTATSHICHLDHHSANTQF